MAIKQFKKNGVGTPIQDNRLPDGQGAANQIFVSNGSTISWQTPVDNLTSSGSQLPLTANQGKILNDRIDNLSQIGRYLSLWDCPTGLPATEPTTVPYSYKAGDYYRVGTIATGAYKHTIQYGDSNDYKAYCVIYTDSDTTITHNDLCAYLLAHGNQYAYGKWGGRDVTNFAPRYSDFLYIVAGGTSSSVDSSSYKSDTVAEATNYRPNGNQYVGRETPSTTVETEDVKVGDVYFYDGSTWSLQINHIGGLVTDVTVNGTSVVSGGVANVVTHNPTIINSQNKYFNDLSNMVVGYTYYRQAVNITWDGDITGKAVIDDDFYKIDDSVELPNINDVIVLVSDGEEISTAVDSLHDASEYFALYSGVVFIVVSSEDDALACIITQDFTYGGDVYSSGTYFIKDGDGTYTSKLALSAGNVINKIPADYVNIDLDRIYEEIDQRQSEYDKVTSWSSPTTDFHYPSEKLVKDSLDAIIPSQSGNSGKFLGTNGTTQSWNNVMSTNVYKQINIPWTFVSGLNGSINYRSVTYGNGRFVCVGDSGNSYYSTNGTSWTTMSGLASGYTFISVTYGNGRFVCVGSSGKSYYSTNGTSWTSMSGLYESNFFGVTYGNDRFVCVGVSRSYYSTDGLTWNGVTISGNNYLECVAYGNGKFVCVGESGKSYYSTDGITWTAMSGLNTSYNYYGVTYGNGRYMCVGNNGIYCSTNGTSWVINETFSTLNSITYDDDKFIGVGNYGKSYVRAYEETIINYIDNNKEAINNKVTTISSSSTDTQYPSAKCVYDAIQSSITNAIGGEY